MANTEYLTTFDTYFNTTMRALLVKGLLNVMEIKTHICPPKMIYHQQLLMIRGDRISEGKCTITYPSAFRRMLYAGDLVTSNLDDEEKVDWVHWTVRRWFISFIMRQLRYHLLTGSHFNVEERHRFMTDTCNQIRFDSHVFECIISHMLVVPYQFYNGL